MFLPQYAFILFLGVLSPKVFPFYEVAISICEGLSFYGFFAMLVHNFGGPNAIVRRMSSLTKAPMCKCPTDAAKFYQRVHTGLWTFLCYRTILTLLAAIFHSMGIMALYGVCTGLTVGILIWSFGSLVFFYENLMDLCGNFNGTYKLLLVKASVGAIVIQGIIFDLLLTFNAKIEDEKGLSEEDNAQQLQCYVLLWEYCIVSALLYCAYGAEMVPLKDDGNSSDDTALHEKSALTFQEFRSRVFSLRDTFQGLDLAQSESNQALMP